MGVREKRELSFDEAMNGEHDGCHDTANRDILHRAPIHAEHLIGNRSTQPRQPANRLAQTKNGSNQKAILSDGSWKMVVGSLRRIASSQRRKIC